MCQLAVSLSAVYNSMNVGGEGSGRLLNSHLELIERKTQLPAE